MGNMNMEISAQQEEWLRQATQDFRSAMETRSTMNVRVAKRVTAILRIGMVSFGLLTLILVLMLFAFTSKMDEMIVALNTMSGQFSSMSKDMTIMKTTLYSMESNVSYMPAITRATSDIRNNMGEMRTEVDDMNNTISSLNMEVLGITNQVSNMTLQMRSIDPAVQHMGRDVYRMSGPARMYKKFNPFD